MYREILRIATGNNSQIAGFHS